MSDTSSQRAQRNIENFEIEKLAQKMIMLRQQHESFEGRAIVQHNEAVYMVRKHILEKAKTFFKEVKDVNINHVLGLSSHKQRQIDNAFEEQCIREMGFERGEQYEDQNMRIIFKTFLKADDPRLEE